MKRVIVAAASFVAVLSAPAYGQMVQARDPSSVVSAAQAGGYSATLGTDSSGDPRITSGASGAKFAINFYGCKENRNCTTVTLYSAWSKKDVSLYQMNEWNKTKRFSRAYIDKDGDPALEFDIDLDDGGMSQALFIDNIQFWEVTVSNFKKYIGL